ncbi:MAG: efflux transporter outer membrane subunit [Syntrophales bacterium]|nr:efflux transporter outer membrane subunit [Syntrophales bacterium]
MRIPPLLLIVFLVSGCFKVGPDYIPPGISAAEQWNARVRGNFNADETDPQILASWWTTLNDPKLSELIKRAVSGNLDLKKAQARIREARAKRGVAGAGLFPTVDATGSATRSKSSEVTGTGSGIGVGLGTTDNLYAVGFDAAWEIDIFGGLRRSLEAAEANIQYSREDWRDVLISLLAEVALNYTDIRTYQSRLAVAKENLEIQNGTYQLTAWRYEAGLSDELAVKQAYYNLENTRSQIPALRAGLESAMNRIAVLLGERPGSVHDELKKAGSIPVTPLEIVVGVPADALRRRPDIRKAERNLAAQTANVGVATAKLYPQFKLNGSIGLEALTANKLVSPTSETFSFGPSLTWRIFDAGAIRQNIKIQSALQEQYLITYESAVLGALEEVENALVNYSEEQYRRESLVKAAQAAKEAAKLAGDKYQAGLTDFTTVLDAQRSLMTYEDQLIQSEGKVTSNLVRLYKTLGGGWASLSDEGK